MSKDNFATTILFGTLILTTYQGVDILIKQFSSKDKYTDEKIT